MEFFLEGLAFGFFVGLLFGEFGEFLKGEPLAIVAKLKASKGSGTHWKGLFACRIGYFLENQFPVGFDTCEHIGHPLPIGGKFESRVGHGFPSGYVFPRHRELGLYLSLDQGHRSDRKYTEE